MPLPAIAVGILAYAGSALAAGPIGRMFGQMGNSIYPNGLLPLPDLITAWRHGWIRDSNMRATSKLHGVLLRNLNRDDLSYTKVINNDLFGTRMIAMHIPNPGKEYTMNERIIQSQQYLPSNDEAVAMLNRRILQPELFARIIRNNANGDMNWIPIWEQMRYQIPGSSDLVRFAVREAFTTQIVQQYGYHHEFPQKILPWMSKQGYDQDLGFAIPIGGTNDDNSPRLGNATWSDLFWWAHWELPAVGQGYEMVFRLYGASDYGPSPDSLIANATFTEEDMGTLLKTQDYPDYWRRRLLAINYMPFTRVDIRRMHQLDIANDADVYHAYRAQGYPDDRAKKLLAFTQEQTRIYKLNRDRKTVNKLCENYIEGLVSRDKILELAQLYDVDPRALDNQLWQCETQDKLNRYKARLKAIRIGYFNGLMDIDGLRQALVLAGTIPQRADQLMELWQLELQFKFKYVSANRVLKWYKMRIIGLDETIARLYNLHILPIDISRMIREKDVETTEAQIKLLDKTTKEANRKQQQAIDKARKDKEKATKLLEKKAKEAKKEAEKTLNRILSAFTDKNLVEWVKGKLINAGQVVTILRAKGWENKAIHSWLVTNKLIGKDDEIPLEENVYAEPQTSEGTESK